MNLIILSSLDACLKPSPPSFSYTPSNFFLPFLCIPGFCFIFSYFICPYFFPFISYTYVFPISPCPAHGSGFIFLDCFTLE